MAVTTFHPATNSRRPKVVEGSYSNSVVRKKSFSKFPVFHLDWLNPMDMVDTGFYCTGNGSEVKCFSCHQAYKSWKKGERPHAVHERISPNCRFLRGLGESDDDSDLETDDDNDTRFRDDVDHLPTRTNDNNSFDEVDGSVSRSINSNRLSTPSSLEVDGSSRLQMDDMNSRSFTSQDKNRIDNTTTKTTTTTDVTVLSE